MSDFVIRLEDEKNELSTKMTKLNEFIGSAAFIKIDPIQQTLLRIQLDSMTTYRQCLIQRLKNL